MLSADLPAKQKVAEAPAAAESLCIRLWHVLLKQAASSAFV
jgi:hypothetical protein